MIRSRLAITFLYALFFFSGWAGLGYQMVWSKMFSAGLGHEMPAVLAVVCAFMGGMAIGAWTLDGVVARSRRPGYWYAALEILIGLWGLLSTAVVPAVNRSASSLTGLEPSALRHWGVAFALPFLALLPATAAMGATLPAMERFLAPLTLHGRCVGALYAANTSGAVAGILLNAFFLAPALGLRQCAWLLAAVNLLCGVAALIVAARLSPSAAVMESSGRAEDSMKLPSNKAAACKDLRASAMPPALSRLRLNTTVFLSGLFGVGFETVSVRVLSQVLENTIYTFATVLAVFLLGTSIGAALYQRFGSRPAPPFLLADLLGTISLACLLSVMAAAHAQPIYDHCRAAFGDSQFSVLAAEMGVAATVLLVPTVFMGATFSHLVQSAAGKAGQASRQPPPGLPPASIAMLASPSLPQAALGSGGTPALPGARPIAGGVGRAAALNTFGGALAPALFGVFLLPIFGSKSTLVLISVGYLTLLPTVARWRCGFLVASVAFMSALPANLHVVQVPLGGWVAEYREGVMASVAVIEDARRDRVLRVDNRFQMGGTAAAAAEYRHAHIPLLLHPAPRRALFLGLGTGISFGAAALHTDVHSDGVELVPEIVQVMGQFEPYNFSPHRRPGTKIFVADARRFVRAASANYDVIVADLFHPARDGAGSLYTLEHFRSVRERLAPGGLFCQWLPLHQLDGDMLRVIIRTFLETFPEAQAWLLRFNVDAPVLGLVGRAKPRNYSVDWVEQRLGDPDLERELKKLALADSIRLFGNLLAGPKALRDFAGDAPLNTDDHPRVTYGAPRFSYQKRAAPYGRLLTLLRLGLPDPVELLRVDSAAGADQFTTRLTRYWNARDVYLNGLMEEAQGRESKAIDLFVASARLSDDFTTGYAQCLSLATIWARTKPAAARALLRRLVEAQPARPVAKEMLEKLFDQ